MTTKERLAEIIHEQDNYYLVVVDGNHQPQTWGKKITTDKELITVAKCKQICERIETQLGITIGNIDIDLTQYDYRSLSPEDYEWGSDVPIPMVGRPKSATYNRKTNCLQIWEDRMPIYENNNGRICRDANALADCLC